MRTESGLLQDPPRSDDRLLIRAMVVALHWLIVSVEGAAFWALFALAVDAAEWSPVVVSEPMTRLKWVVLLGAVTGAGRMLHEWDARQHGEKA